MTSQDYQKLKAVIQNANPELMELKFGCEFDWTNEKLEQDRFFVLSNNPTQNLLTGIEGFTLQAVKLNGHRDIFSFDNPDDYTDGETFFTFAKILGRPIRLADVLIAVRERFKPIAGYEALPILDRWNLLNDNLDHQSDECRQFLYELLGKDTA